MKYPHLFAPLEIRGVFFKNRVLALEPPSRPDLRGAEAAQTLIDSTELLARGGAAAVTLPSSFSAEADAAEREERLICVESVRCHGCVAAFPLRLPADSSRAAHAALTQVAKAAVSLGCRMIVLSGLHTGEPPYSALRAVRAAAGEDTVLALRVECDETDADALSALCAELEPALDMVLVTPARQSGEFDDHGRILPLCGKFKAALHIAVAAGDGFNDPRQAENALLAGQCDLVVLRRQMLADPFFVRKTAEKHEDEIVPCLRCGLCEPDALPDEPFQCAANPRVRREARLNRVGAVTSPKKILVVGAGPAGIYAAIAAAERGHHVRLVEKEKRIGGLLRFAAESRSKNDLRRLRDSLSARLEHSGVELCTGVSAGRDYIERYAPDAVILAIGAAPMLPPIPGLAVFAHPALWAYAHPDELGKRIVVIGGGLTGVECAMHLACEDGREVTVLEAGREWGRDAYPAQRAAIERALPPNLRIRTGVRCTEVRPGGVAYRARNGRRVELEADTVLYAVGMQPKRAELAELLRAHPNTCIIGDGRSPGRLYQALRDGLFAAYDIN